MDLPGKTTPHGTIKSLTYSVTTHSMMFGGGSSRTESIDWKKNGKVVYTSSSRNSNSYSNYEYELTKEGAEKLKNFADEKLLKLENVKLPNTYMGVDNCTISTFSLTYDDTSVGGSSDTIIHINLGIGIFFGNIENDFDDILKECLKDAVRIKADIKTFTETGFGMESMFGMNDTIPKFSPDMSNSNVKSQSEFWVCNDCGYQQNKGKFCEECGSPR